MENRCKICGLEYEADDYITGSFAVCKCEKLNKLSIAERERLEQRALKERGKPLNTLLNKEAPKKADGENDDDDWLLEWDEIVGATLKVRERISSCKTREEVHEIQCFIKEKLEKLLGTGSLFGYDFCSDTMPCLCIESDKITANNMLDFLKRLIEEPEYLEERRAALGEHEKVSDMVNARANDTSADHQYVFAVSELTDERTVTLPLFTGNDEFTFNDHTQTLTNKTLTSNEQNEKMRTASRAALEEHAKVGDMVNARVNDINEIMSLTPEWDEIESMIKDYEKEIEEELDKLKNDVKIFPFGPKQIKRMRESLEKKIDSYSDIDEEYRESLGELVMDRMDIVIEKIEKAKDKEKKKFHEDPYFYGRTALDLPWSEKVIGPRKAADFTFIGGPKVTEKSGIASAALEIIEGLIEESIDKEEARVIYESFKEIFMRETK